MKNPMMQLRLLEVEHRNRLRRHYEKNPEIEAEANRFHDDLERFIDAYIEKRNAVKDALGQM